MRAWNVFAVGILASAFTGDARAQIACAPGSQSFGDIDERGDVAIGDWSALVECLSGPGKEPDPKLPLDSSKCLGVFDGDKDGDVDAVDAARFARSFTGACDGLGECPSGMHLEHVSGQVGLVNADSFDNETAIDEPMPEPAPLNPDEYRCVPNETCLGVECSDNGYCEVMSGKAVCSCKPGYAGEACDRCATGYQFDRIKGCVLGSECRERFCSGQGDCLVQGGEIKCDCDVGTSGTHCQNGGSGPSLRAPTYVEIRGTDRSMEQGEQREICATLFGGGMISQPLIWSIEGPGAFTTFKNCMVYVAPQPGSFAESRVVTIRACSQMFPDQCAIRYLTVDPQGSVRSTGQSHVMLKPFDDAMKQYMLHRCVGGAVLGVSVFGKPVFVRGYGNLSGAPTNDSGYLDACGDTFDISGMVPGHFLPAPAEVQPNTPFRIGSISKSVTAAILRKHVKEQINAADTDADVEALAVCDELLPGPLHEVACQAEPTPIILGSLSGLPPDCDSSDPCPYGGTCVATNLVTNEGYCDGCPQGRSGADCSRVDVFCTPGLADERWQNMTLGHILGHRSGLPRSVPSLIEVILPRLYQLRGLMTEMDWDNQQAQLLSESNWPNGDFDVEFPNFGGASGDLGPDYYFVPRPTVEDAVLARMGACLATAPGSNTSYSNTGFALLGVIAEYITGRNFSGKLGQPNLHTGSMLEEFNADQLGLPVPGQGTAEGMFHSQDVFDIRNPAEPVYRAWSTVTNSYYKPVNDEKRPYCEWDDGIGSCNFNEWIDAATRYDWRFENQQVLTGYQGGSFGGPATAGSIATEAEVFLRFMAKFWVGGDGGNPRYGESRCPDGNCVWTLATGHNGARDGTYAEAKQLGGPVKVIPQDLCVDDDDCPTYTACNNTGQESTVQEFCRSGKCWRYNEYFIPPVDPVTGAITDDFGNLECRTCRLPAGVDIFVALNQQSDKKCREKQDGDPNDPDYYTCSTAYGRLPDFLLHAACQVQWPANPYQLWPPVFENGGSSMAPEFAP